MPIFHKNEINMITTKGRPALILLFNLIKYIFIHFRLIELFRIVLI